MVSLAQAPPPLTLWVAVTVVGKLHQPDAFRHCRPVWTSNGGTVTGTGSSARLAHWAHLGSITVSATCTDSRGLTVRLGAGDGGRIRRHLLPIRKSLTPNPGLPYAPYFYFPTPWSARYQKPMGVCLPAAPKKLAVALAADFKKTSRRRHDAHRFSKATPDIRGNRDDIQSGAFRAPGQ